MGVVFCLSLPLFSFLCFPVGCCFVAPLEEKKTTGDRNERQRRWRGRAGWSFCVFCCLSFFFCSSLLCPSSTVCSLVFFPVLPVLALLNRKWLLWGSGEAGLGLRWQRRLFRVQERNGRERGMAKGGTGFGCSLFLVYKTELSAFPPKRTPPSVVSALLGLFASFPSFPFPSFGFPALSPIFKNSSPSFQKTLPPLLVFQPSLLFSKTLLLSLLQLRQRGAGQQHAHGEQGTPSQGSLRCSHAPALLPTPEGLGQRHAHGGNGVYTILGCFLFFFLFFYFYRDPKMGYNKQIKQYIIDNNAKFKA